MDDYKTSEAYRENFEVFGIFGMEQIGKMWTTFTIMVLLYPNVAFIFGYKSIERFGDFVEHTAVFVLLFGVFVQLINVWIRQNKIIEIAELFQELKKFDENEIVKKSEFVLERTMKIWLVLEMPWKISHFSVLIGIVDWSVVALFTVFWINSQAFLFMAYTQLTAHMKCLAVKFEKIGKPQNAGDSTENLEKLHEFQ
jgi:hypothetical protein